MAGAALLMVVVQTGVNAQQAQPAQMRRWQGQLDLTEEQRAQIQQISEQHREALREAQAAMIQARADLDKLRTAGDPDLRELERAMNALSQLENAQKIQTIRNRAEMMDVFTEEQQQLLGRTAGFLGGQGMIGHARMFGGRGSMGRGHTGFRRGRGAMPGRVGSGRGRGVMQGNAGYGRGRGVMPGNAGFGRGWSGNTGRFSGRGGSMGTWNRGRVIPHGLQSGQRPYENLREWFGGQGMHGMMDRGIMRGRGMGSVTPPPPPPPPAG